VGYSKSVKALALLFVVAMCTLACNSSDGAEDDSKAPQVIYLVTDFGTITDGAPTSRLMTAGIDGSGTRQILQTRAVYGSFSVDPEVKKIGLTTNYTDGSPELLIGDLASGEIERVGLTEGGAGSVFLGPRGSVAFCDVDSNLVVGVIDSIDAGESLEHRWGIHCPNAAWSPDSRLAFLANPPQARPRDASVALYLRDTDGTVEHIDLPGASAVGSLDWSADGERVVLAAGESMMIVNAITREVTALGNGLDPAFSPLDTTIVASARYEPSQGVDVWQDDKIVASLDGGEGPVAWCPGGELIVFLSGQLSVWNWKTGDTRVIADLNWEDDRKVIEGSLDCV
jgi:hypothetical protein